MGMSMHVVGYKEADKKWAEMKSVWDSCLAAKIDPPKQVEDFFDGEYPGDAPGMEVNVLGVAGSKWIDDGREGFQINVSKLPPGVAFLRFFCSW